MTNELSHHAQTRGESVAVAAERLSEPLTALAATALVAMVASCAVIAWSSCAKAAVAVARVAAVMAPGERSPETSDASPSEEELSVKAGEAVFVAVSVAACDANVVKAAVEAEIEATVEPERKSKVKAAGKARHCAGGTPTPTAVALKGELWPIAGV